MKKRKQIHEAKTEDLKKQLNELRLELSKDRSQIAVGGTPTNPGKIREKRRTIARILTELKIREAKKVA